jgi:hypothetical protein
MDPFIEMTVRIDADAHPLLYQDLSMRQRGKPRAAALKRLAENYLLLSRNNPAHASPGTTSNSEAREADMQAGQSRPEDPAPVARVNASDVRSSLTQFLPAGRR